MIALRHMTRSQFLALALAAAVLAAGILLFWLAVPGPLMAREARIAEIRKEIVILEKQRARLGDPDRWRMAEERALAARSEFLLKDSGAPPFARIQSVMRSAANEAGVSVISAQDFSPGVADPNAVGVRMNVVGDLNAVTEFLTALSLAHPRLVIGEFSIRHQAGDAAAAEYNVNIGAVALYWSEGGA